MLWMIERSQTCRMVSACKIWAVGICVVTGVAGCREGGRDGVSQVFEREPISVVNGRTFGELFATVDSLVLEESENVVTVQPHVSIDPRGGFLVADSRESQVRVYSRTGALERVLSDGSERTVYLERPYGASRMANGDIVVADFASGSITVIPTHPEEPARIIETPIFPLVDVKVLNERQVLLLGEDSVYARALLHVWDLPSGEIVKSFYPPPKHLDQDVVATLGRVSTASRGNKVAAVYSLSDTLVFFDRDGNELSRVHIPIDPFIAPTGPLPEVNTFRAQQAWVSQFTFISGVFWIGEDQLLVQWELANGFQADYGLVQMDTTGRRIWGMAPAPRLFGVRDDEFFFQDPSSDALNRWIVATQNAEILTCLKSVRSTNHQGEDSCGE